MKAPSFFIAEESNDGVTMEYRSKRRGFQYYVQGQIKELSKNFANEIKKLEIEMKKQEVKKCCKPVIIIFKKINYNYTKRQGCLRYRGNLLRAEV